MLKREGSLPRNDEGTSGGPYGRGCSKIFESNEEVAQRPASSCRMMQIAKHIAGVTLRHQKVNDWTLWRGRPPPKRKKYLLMPLV
jgi:hypothetical protein